MTPNEKILKRALEMALKKIWQGAEVPGCQEMGCKYYGPQGHDKCDTDGCEEALYEHIIRKAKEAVK